MKMSLLTVAALVLSTSPSAQTSINLSNYQLKATYSLSVLGDMGLEASAVTYARDRGSLFFVGDEGLGVVEISKTGTTLGSMSFTWPAASTNNDAEGLTYLGSGTLVVAEERLQDAFRFTFVNGGTAALESAPFVSFGANAGNNGAEGISVDPRNGRFVTVKQAGPQEVLEGTLSFAVAGGASAMTSLFDPALLSLASLSDVQALSPIDALASQPAANNLLILSLDSKKLVEVTRAGATLSSFDLAPLTTQAIEGVTVDELGVIYLVAEGDSAGNTSKLFVLAPIPEPEQYLLMLVGLIGLGMRLRARRSPAHQ